MERDFYDILGVRPTASPEAVKRAYRRLAKRYHPDVDRSRGAHERFLEVQEAYELLSNPLLRREYDERAGREPASVRGAGVRAPGTPRKVRVSRAYVRVASPFRGYRDRIETIRDRAMDKRARTARTVWRVYVVTVLSMSGVLGLSSASLLAAGAAFPSVVTGISSAMMLLLLFIAWLAKGAVAPDL